MLPPTQALRGRLNCLLGNLTDEGGCGSFPSRSGDANNRCFDRFHEYLGIIGKGQATLHRSFDNGQDQAGSRRKGKQRPLDPIIQRVVSQNQFNTQSTQVLDFVYQFRLMAFIVKNHVRLIAGKVTCQRLPLSGGTQNQHIFSLPIFHRHPYAIAIATLKIPKRRLISQNR